MEKLNAISEDTARSPKERDLARILSLAASLLERGDYEMSKNLLKLYLEKLED